MDTLLISFLMTVRIRTDLSNPKSRDILKFFSKMVEELHPSDRNKVEFLIKFDEDDRQARGLVNSRRFDEFKLNIKTFFYRRWEGMYSAHHNYSFLLLQASPYSKYIGFCGDDSTPQHLSRAKNLKQLEEHKNDYVFFTPRSNVYSLDNYNKVKVKTALSIDVLNNTVCEPYPIVSKKILKICSGVGFYHNIDSWWGLVNYFLICDFGVSIVKKLNAQHFVRDNNQKEDLINDSFQLDDGSYDSRFNKNILSLPSYIIMCRQQAKNIYLNIKEEGVLDVYKIS